MFFKNCFCLNGKSITLGNFKEETVTLKGLILNILRNEINVKGLFPLQRFFNSYATIQREQAEGKPVVCIAILPELYQNCVVT